MEVKSTYYKFWIPSFLTILLASNSQGFSSEDYYKAEKDLIDKLLTGYNPNIRPKPVTNGTWDSENFQVYVSLSLNAMMGIDEIEETMSTSMVFTILWFDEKLYWNPEDHMNITQVYLKASEVWRPLWFVANSVERESDTASSKEWVPVYFRSDGRAMWQDQLPLKTECDVDTTYYPFDQQSCGVLLQWYEYEIDVRIVNQERHLDQYRDNALWDLYNYSMHAQKEGYPDFTLTYFFHRKPDHTIYNVLFPVMVIALLGPLVFLLPAESGERTGYIITVLLSVSVYMIIISDQLPRSSSPMSLLTYVLFAWYVLCALIVVVVIIQAKIYSFDSSKPVPRPLKWMVTCLRCRCCKDGDSRKGKRKGNSGDESESSPCVVNGHGDNVEDAHDSADGNVSWPSVGRAIDRVALWVFYFLKVSFVIIFAMVLNMNHFH